MILGILANVFRSSPQGSSSIASSWSRKRKDMGHRKNFMSQRAKKVKADVMALSYRERQRIKNMIRVRRPALVSADRQQDPKRRPPPQPGVLIETRIVRLPKIPVAKDRLNSGECAAPLPLISAFSVRKRCAEGVYGPAVQ